MPDFVCLFFDIDGIVRATDTIAVDTAEKAAEKARDLLGTMNSLSHVELWLDGKRVFRSARKH